MTIRINGHKGEDRAEQLLVSSSTTMQVRQESLAPSMDYCFVFPFKSSPTVQVANFTVVKVCQKPEKIHNPDLGRLGGRPTCKVGFQPIEAADRGVDRSHSHYNKLLNHHTDFKAL